MMNAKAPVKKEKQQPCRTEKKSSVISYRWKCAESGNGLSHYIMYGDLPEETRTW